ncbi:5-methyltetrahydropteroyltriglutamate--homocysteine S-methyltransferase, partial [Aerococcus urinae]|nr:5-methyltetrahydropteroyltriglutamate--homocysteine S-methyltransferase [Aerococcus urinae]
SVGTLALDTSYLERVAKLAEVTHLSAGLVDGRNVWAANLRDLREKLESLGADVSVTTSVSLQHVPHTVEAETSLPVDVATWFAFADEKIREVVALAAGPL